MTPSLRLALIGLNQTPLDWSGNMARIHKGLDHARAQGAELVLFPELTVSGYGCEDFFYSPDVARRSLSLIMDLARNCTDMVVLVGLPLWFEEHCYNGLALLAGGCVQAITLKTHLARDGIHYEPRWFLPWPWGRKAQLTLPDGSEIPVGALGYVTAGLPFTVEICEDAWVGADRRPCQLFEPAQWVFNASASHFSMRKADTRERIMRESAQKFGVGYAYANLVGCESGRAVYDGELLVAQDGAIVNRSDRLYLDDVRLLCHDLSYTPVDDIPGAVVLPLQPREDKPLIAPPRQDRLFAARAEEFAWSGSLALLDYMRKSRAQGFTLSLSGGVDSSTVAVLVWILAHRLTQELTADERIDKLGHLRDVDLTTDDARTLVGDLLTTVYQATRNSGPVTREAASGLAEAIGARHLEFDIDELVAGYERMVGDAIGRPLTWAQDDIAKQNIQARVRAPGVWMLANLRGSLLLSTSNRSEVAVGYATMDGDTAGGLSPIAGVEKSFLSKWLQIMERDGVLNVPALPVLHRVNDQEPTAELRPPDRSQRDEDDLMPYAVLDALEEAITGRRLSPREAAEAVAAQTDYPIRQIRAWTVKFCRLFAQSQWKRERYAPAFHLDIRNLDPKTWARFPILSGGFRDELLEMDSWP